jgi:hypothetical protein
MPEMSEYNNTIKFKIIAGDYKIMMKFSSHFRNLNYLYVICMFYCVIYEFVEALSEFFFYLNKVIINKYSLS